MQHDIEVCRLVGARSRALGLVAVDESLDSLLDERGGGAATILGTYPSYLAQLVTAARRRGLGPHDFSLRRIDVAGELLSPAVAAAAHDTLGARPSDTFAMTEVLPVSGRTCDQGHLHVDLNMGLVEVIALDGSEPAAPGELGTMVVTPFFPYRECMPVFRYDTRDVVRQLPDEPLTCNLAGIPALSPILGKAGRSSPPITVWSRPARSSRSSRVCRPPHGPPATRPAASGGVLRLTLPPTALAGTTTEHIARLFAAAGIDCTVDVAADDASLRTVRADLAETTFTAPPALIGA